MVLSHVMRGRPSCLLQSAGAEANRILLASALSPMRIRRIICPNKVSRRDWMVAVSLGCFVSLRTSSFRKNWYHPMPSSIYADTTGRRASILIVMQTTLSKLQDWSESWLLRLNIQKFKAVSYGRNVNKDYKYRMVGLQEGTNITVQRDDHIKDLGIIFYKKLDFGLHVAEKVNKAYSTLWLIKRNFKDIGAEAFVTLYMHLIRSHLEYNNSVWSPHKKSDIEK